MFKYLPKIISAIERLYQNDINLFEGKTHEQTFSYRIALYLSQDLEKKNKGLFVDCEYHRNIYSAVGKKYIEHYGYFRPDIIYHNRGRDNQFCIELKKRSLTKKHIGQHCVTDKDKIKGMIDHFHYKEGFCIYNLTKNGVTIWCKNEDSEQEIKYLFHNNRLTEKH